MTNDEYSQLIEFLGRKFEEIDRRFDRVEAKLEVHDRRFDTVEAKLEVHDRRFDTVEAKLAEHDERFGDILGHFDHLYRRLERLEQEYQAILEGLRRIEALLVDEKARREDLERGLELLKHHVAALQTRIERLEQSLRQ